MQKKLKSGSSFLPLGVAFNPHIGGALDPGGGRAEEWERLLRKLRSGVVSEVCIPLPPIGLHDYAGLDSALQHLAFRDPTR